MEATPKNGYLPRKTFFWVMGVFIMLVVTVLGYQIGKIDKLDETYNHSVTSIKVDVAEIKTDLRLLRESLR